MERFKSCLICMQVPEMEIYQCYRGHIICHTCISRVYGDTCPQCRALFGEPKIRCLVLEQILDSQQFQCKFVERGCTHLSQRGDITNHVNSCSRKVKRIPSSNFWLYGVFCQNSDESSPLFMILLNYEQDNATVMCIKICHPESHPATKYIMECEFNRDFTSSSSSPPNVIQTRLMRLKLWQAPVEDVLPISWKSQVWSLKEAHRILRSGNPVSIFNPAIERYRFGSDKGDYVRFRVFRSNE